MRKLGLWAVRPKRNTQQAASRAQGLPVPSARQDDSTSRNQVWAADINVHTHAARVFCTWSAIIDWGRPRRVLVLGRLSNTLTAGVLCRGAERGPSSGSAIPASSIPIKGRNSPATSLPRCCGITGSRSAWMDAGAATTTSSSERLWWTVKHEWVYLRPAANGIEQKRSPCRVLRLVIICGVRIRRSAGEHRTRPLPSANRRLRRPTGRPERHAKQVL